MNGSMGRNGLLPAMEPNDFVARFWFSLGVVLIVFLPFALLSVAINEKLSIHIGPIYLEGNTVGKSELRDRLLYLSLYFVAPIAVFAANRFVPATRLPPQSNAIALVPALVLVHLGLSATKVGWQLFFLCLSLALTIAALRLRRGQGAIGSEELQWREPRLGWLDLVAMAAFFVLLLPASVDRLAAHIGINIAKISYIVGPALYSYGNNLTPGLDFYSHYGPGLGPVFSLFLGSGWRSTAVNAIEFTLVVTAIFYCAEYLLLLFLTGSRALAFAVPAFVVLLNFSTYFPFDAPSAYPVRYPLLIPFVLAFGWLCEVRRSLAPVLVMSVLAGLSLFWHTEIGLYLILAGAGGIFVALGFGPFGLGRIALFSVGSLLSFYAVSWVFVGTAALSLKYLVAAVQPITAYTAGWDGVPVVWDTIWSVFYNLPLQGAALVTIGYFWHLMWRGDSLSARERRVAGVLVMMSLIGLGMLTKWVNRSQDAEWHQNAGPLVMVMAWWVHFLWANSGARAAFMKLGLGVRAAAASALLALTIAILSFVEDRANPHVYGLRSYLHYPNLVKAAIAPSQLFKPVPGVTTWTWPDLLSSISTDDVALIQRHVPPRERALVVSVVDWAYLAQAQRAPKAIFMPILWSFDVAFLEPSMVGADIIFVDERFRARPDTPGSAFLAAALARDYVAGERSSTLTLYRSKKSQQADRPRDGRSQ